MTPSPSLQCASMALATGYRISREPFRNERKGYPSPKLLAVMFLLGASRLCFSHPRRLNDVAPRRLPCEASGMCSLGKVKTFTGDIMPPASLRACLAARTFRSELILLTDTRLNPAYQLFSNLLSMGYEHTVLLSSPERCQHSSLIWPRMACVWSFQNFRGNTKYLMDRVALMARAARLGTNVLLLDTDVLVFGDVYSHLKGPVLGSSNLMAMRDGNGWLNCGVVYIQNARPDGPATYMLAEIVDRLERWAEGAAFLTGRNLPAGCWDQTMYSDTLLSVLAGRPVSYGCWLPYEPSLLKEWEAAHLALFGRKEGSLGVDVYLQVTRQSWPSELTAAAPNYPNAVANEIWSGLMTVPNSKGVWPPELGGPLYPPNRGPNSETWRDLLKADILPLWPDPEDPAQAAAGAAISERFTYLPIYLAETWSLGGAYGYWNPGLRAPAPQPPVALAHFVHVPGGATNKLTVKMASANWDWDLAHCAHPHRGVFFASTRSHPVPDVLAYSSQVEAQLAAGTEADFAGGVMALLRLGMELGRAVAYPAPPCNVSWMGGEANNNLPLRVHHGLHVPYSPPGAGFSDLRCLWAGYLLYGCQAVRPYFSGGLLAPEYDHLLQLISEEGPSPAATAARAAHATHLGKLGIAALPEHLLYAADVTTTNNTSAAVNGNIKNNADGMSYSSHSGGAGGNSAVHPGIVHIHPEAIKLPADKSFTATATTATANITNNSSLTGGWNVSELAAIIMQQYGGPGSGLLLAAADKTAGGTGGGGTGLGGAESSSSTHSNHVVGGGNGDRPRVLVLPAVPQLSDWRGPRHDLFVKELETGEDQAAMSCEWIRTGRPYRRRRQRALSGAARGEEEREDAGAGEEGGPGQWWWETGW